jgi:hypothetical protein
VIGARKETAKVELESGEIRIGAPWKRKVLFGELKGFEAEKGTLTLTTARRETILIALGKDAQKWELKIRYPRGRLDKLGVKPGMRVAVLNVDEAGFREELEERTEDVSVGRPRKDSDIVVVGMSARADLARLATLRASIKKDGAVWVVWPKGRKEFREDDVRAFGPAAGLVDVKVMSFSDTLSGLKMVIPVKER